MTTEYKTTTGQAAHRSMGDYYDVDDPEPPAGDGWEMCGAAASGGELFWFWRRDAEHGETP